MAGWLLPFVFLACYPLSPLGWRGWQGVVAVLSARQGVPCSLTSIRFFYALIALQGSLPDIKCETDININLLENCNF